MPLQITTPSTSPLLIIEAIFCAYNEFVTEHLRKGRVSLLQFFPVLLSIVGNLFSLDNTSSEKKTLEPESREINWFVWRK